MRWHRHSMFLLGRRLIAPQKWGSYSCESMLWPMVGYPQLTIGRTKDGNIDHGGGVEADLENCQMIMVTHFVALVDYKECG